MNTELTVLALAGILQGLQFALFSVRANLDVGPGYAMSARDREPSRPMSILGGRLQRAMNNHFEALVLFTMAVVVVTLGEKSSVLTAICAWTYLAARVVYVPAYCFGWRPGRSLIWFVGFCATFVMLVAALLG